MKLLIATDAWHPQVNGVVRTYQNILPHLENMMVACTVLHPYREGFERFSLPAYPEIEIVKNPWMITEKLERMVDNHTFIHIATEGPIGLMTRRFCVKNKLRFTTCFHTMFPEFINRRWHVPTALTYPYFRWFHKNSTAILCPTAAIAEHLHKKNLHHTALWTRGVDSNLFTPALRKQKTEKYILCVSRVSEEKGLDDFCKLDYTKKVVVGDGPYLETLKKKYPSVIFAGMQQGRDLATWYANAECFVFPSKTDTFGIVLLEAIASGIPVAAYPQPGPREVIEQDVNGWIDHDLQYALDQSLNLDKHKIADTATKWTWQYSAKQFLDTIKQSNMIK